MSNPVKSLQPKSRLIKALRALLANERGSALGVVVIALPLVLGSVGLAVDTAQWVLLKRQLQQAADSAAMAGSFATLQGGDIDGMVDRDLDTRRAALGTLTARAEISPVGHDGDPNAVAVHLTAPGAFTFSSLFLRHPVIVAAEATATVVKSDDFCGFALADGSDAGIVVKPNSTVEAECGLATNSTAANAVLADATTQVAAKKLFALGGILGTAVASSGRVHPHALRQADPLADTVPPAVPNTGCPNITINGDASGNTQLKPGCYGNIILDGKVTLLAGDYILNRGSLILGSTADVTCVGCTFFLTSEDAATSPGSIGSLKADKDATLNLSAPSEGPYGGILIYQDRRATQNGEGDENVLAANARSKVSGLLYFPSQDLAVDASAAANLSCSRFIGSRLILSGRLVIATGCSAETGKIALSGAEVRLVG